MLLILEIYLTVSAWRKGWNALALFPGVAVFLFGIFIGSSGMDKDQAMGLAIAGDILTCIVLGVMAAQGRASKQRAIASTDASSDFDRASGSTAYIAVPVGKE